MQSATPDLEKVARPTKRFAAEEFYKDKSEKCLSGILEYNIVLQHKKNV